MAGTKQLEKKNAGYFWTLNVSLQKIENGKGEEKEGIINFQKKTDVQPFLKILSNFIDNPGKFQQTQS